jgi:hypothetical protein
MEQQVVVLVYSMPEAGLTVYQQLKRNLRLAKVVEEAVELLRLKNWVAMVELLEQLKWMVVAAAEEVVVEEPHSMKMSDRLVQRFSS